MKMKMKMKMMAMFLISLFSTFFLFSLYSDAPFTSTPIGHERMLVAYLDGTVSLINDTETQDVLWSVKTGRPICGSYRASPNLDAYLDCGHDWNFYKHNRRNGTVKRVQTNDDEMGTEMHEFVGLGVVVWVKIKIGVTIVDADTGYALKRALGVDIPEDEEKKPVVDRNNIREKFYIRRVDFELGVETVKDRNIIWNASVAEFKVVSHCAAKASPSCQMHYVPIHRVHIAHSDV